MNIQRAALVPPSRLSRSQPECNCRRDLPKETTMPTITITFSHPAPVRLPKASFRKRPPRVKMSGTKQAAE